MFSMDKTISARVEEAIAALIGVLSRQLGYSKKRVLEEAITMYARHMQGQTDTTSLDIFASTCGAWERSETPDQTVSKARGVFNQSMHRRKQ